MKAKLLKKVRKRFEIIHHPKGISKHGDIYDFNLFELTDVTNSYYSHYAQCGMQTDVKKQYCDSNKIFETDKECIDYLKTAIIQKLRNEGHRAKKDSLIKTAAKKVWYK